MNESQTDDDNLKKIQTELDSKFDLDSELKKLADDSEQIQVDQWQIEYFYELQLFTQICESEVKDYTCQNFKYQSEQKPYDEKINDQKQFLQNKGEPYISNKIILKQGQTFVVDEQEKYDFQCDELKPETDNYSCFLRFQKKDGDEEYKKDEEEKDKIVAEINQISKKWSFNIIVKMKMNKLLRVLRIINYILDTNQINNSSMTIETNLIESNNCNLTLQDVDLFFDYFNQSNMFQKVGQIINQIDFEGNQVFPLTWQDFYAINFDDMFNNNCDLIEKFKLFNPPTIQHERIEKRSRLSLIRYKFAYDLNIYHMVPNHEILKQSLIFRPDQSYFNNTQIMDQFKINLDQENKSKPEKMQPINEQLSFDIPEKQKIEFKCQYK